MTWRFTVPGQPRGKGRPRFTQTGRVFTDAKTRAYEVLVAKHAAESMPFDRIQGAVCVNILIVLKRPQRLLPKRYPRGLLWAPVRPDRDNIEKAILDGMKAQWRDDAQVVDGRTRKVYAERDGSPRVEVEVSLITTEDL